MSRHEWLIAPLLLQGSASRMRGFYWRYRSILNESDNAVRSGEVPDTVEWDDAQGTLKACVGCKSVS
ncbi:hypothetical protein ACLK1T_06765 [Escherichia coli]